MFRTVLSKIEILYKWIGPPRNTEDGLYPHHPLGTSLNSTFVNIIAFKTFQIRLLCIHPLIAIVAPNNHRLQEIQCKQRFFFKNPSSKTL